MSRVFNGAVNICVANSAISVNNAGFNSNTYSAWVFPTSFGTTTGNGPGWILSQGDGGAGGSSNRWGVFLTKSSTGSGGTITARTNGKTNSQSVSVDSVIPLNQWSFVTYVFDHATLISHIYVNGVEVSYSSQTTGVTPSNIAATIFVGNGANTFTPNAGFTGNIDTVAVWTRVLSQTEIQTSMGYQGVPKVPTNLVAYWPLLGVTSPEPNALSGQSANTMILVVPADDPQGPNSPGQTPPSVSTAKGSSVVVTGSADISERVQNFMGTVSKFGSRVH